MPEEASYSDHDLLILLVERSRIQAEKTDELKMYVKDEVDDIKNRLTEVERYQDTQKGIFSGGKLIFTLLGSLPTASVVALVELIQRT